MSVVKGEIRAEVLKDYAAIYLSERDLQEIEQFKRNEFFATVSFKAECLQTNLRINVSTTTLRRRNLRKSAKNALLLLCDFMQVLFA